MRFPLLIGSLWLAATPALAQIEGAQSPAETPDPQSEELGEEFSEEEFGEEELSEEELFDERVSAQELSDEELIRWACREIALHAGRSYGGRSLGNHPPVPPDGYLVNSSRPMAFPGESDGRTALRLLAEAGGGAVGLLLGGGVGVLLTWAAIEGRAGPSWVAVTIGAGATLGALGLTAGVTLAADLSGGRGNFGHAFMGQVVGAVAALPLVVLGQANDSLGLSLLAAGLLPLAGAILGYEIGHSDRALSGGAMAYLVPTDGGALAGVAGPLP